jgi:hypothetical protein
MHINSFICLPLNSRANSFRLFCENALSQLVKISVCICKTNPSSVTHTHTHTHRLHIVSRKCFQRVKKNITNWLYGFCNCKLSKHCRYWIGILSFRDSRVSEWDWIEWLDAESFFRRQKWWNENLQSKWESALIKYDAMMIYWNIISSHINKSIYCVRDSRCKMKSSTSKWCRPLDRKKKNNNHGL